MVFPEWWWGLLGSDASISVMNSCTWSQQMPSIYSNEMLLETFYWHNNYATCKYYSIIGHILSIASHLILIKLLSTVIALDSIWYAYSLFITQDDTFNYGTNISYTLAIGVLNSATRSHTVLHLFTVHRVIYSNPQRNLDPASFTSHESTVISLIWIIKISH